MLLLLPKPLSKHLVVCTLILVLFKYCETLVMKIVKMTTMDS